MKMYSDFYNEVANELGFDESKIPKRNTEFVAYENAQAVRDNKILGKDANQYFLQRKYPKAIIEEVGDLTEYNNYWETRKLIEREAQLRWFDYLKTYYNTVNEKTFDLCYDMAYERGHSGSYSEVQNFLSDYIAFALDIIHANRNA